MYGTEREWVKFVRVSRARDSDKQNNYIIVNSVMPYYIIRRAGQVYGLSAGFSRGGGGVPRVLHKMRVRAIFEDLF